LPRYINSEFWIGDFGLAILDWRFWIGDFGLLIPEFAGLPAIESLALFPRIDIMPLC
jgi:hypothetical protein